MEIEDLSNKSENTTESEEDYGCFFLQPATNPYNIAEKVQQANKDLYASNNNNNNENGNNKSNKVKFCDELLVSYEPDLTDDDVKSIESDDSPHFNTIKLKNNLNNTNNCQMKLDKDKKLNIFDIAEEIDAEDENGDEVIEELIDSNVTEEITSNTSNMSNENNNNNDSYSSNTTSIISSSYNRKTAVKKGRKAKKAEKLPKEIDCKKHCIEKIEPPDRSMVINKVQVPTKMAPVLNLNLKLYDRKCCDKQQQMLPSYNGLRSEYGLSQHQLIVREKQRELLKKREENRRRLLEEYKTRRLQQNELVFSQWLKNVSKRKTIRNNYNNHLKTSGFNANNKILTSKLNDVRPKSTGSQMSAKKSKVKSNRPHTSQSCVFIEVPQKYLRNGRGIQISDLLVTNNLSLMTKKLHILSIS